MANANPVCSRCFSKKVWIGIGPGAEAVCIKDCSGYWCPICRIQAQEVEVYASDQISTEHMIWCVACNTRYHKEIAA